MKVGHILYGGLGGHGSVFFSLARAPSSANAHHYPIFYGIESVRTEYLAGCSELKLKLYSVLKKPGEHLAPQFKLWKILKSSAPDAVIVHSSPCILAALLYRLTNGMKPVILVEHQNGKLKTKYEKLLTALGPWLCQKVIYLTEESRADAQINLGKLYRKGRTKVIANGVDTTYFCPASTPKAHPHFRIGMAARMTPLKDFESLIQALHIASAIDNSLVLVLAGDGPSRPSLETLAKELNLQERVSFAGLLNETELLDFYQNLDIYVHSTRGETMSTSIMQAQACGLPVIATDVDGVRHQVRHQLDGILTSPESPSALASQFLKLKANIDVRERLSHEAREKAIDEYSHVTMRHKYDHAIQELLQAKR